ncbi:hypothetical protein [Streptomyces sp. SID13726]|uniref:hypothetical protein n=1 Tax=Streptomyces sp. SID13726 TaxID=2706058 RepID=UPI0013B74A3F|nr:hypothetical protein [Streptomyces sp. SID13726]NEA99051.1 hypothetical protein [Streptomyces sp. SID13726]
MSDTHQMVLTRTVDSGAEEWSCLSCDRRMLLRWPPHYERRILEAGDENATHVGGKGGVRMGTVEVTPASVPPVAEHDIRWLQDNGIDWNGS